MILEIPEGQVCQAFDPMMILPEKTFGIELKKPPNTSCVAPSSVYIEGIRGKRFLCDYHYFYEKSMSSARSEEQWPLVASVFVDEREKIKDTFQKLSYSSRTFIEKCWCDNEAFVKVTDKNQDTSDYFCNFHYRKKLYRELSNDINTAEINDIVDERVFMKTTIKEEAENAKWV
jgi:hypothetical protein